jgi:hypothetical protein
VLVSVAGVVLVSVAGVVVASPPPPPPPQPDIKNELSASAPMTKARFVQIEFFIVFFLKDNADPLPEGPAKNSKPLFRA